MGSSINSDEMYNVENTIIRHRHMLKILYCMINDQIFATSSVATESSTTWCWPLYGRRVDYGNTKIAHPALNYTVMVKLFTTDLCWIKEDVSCTIVHRSMFLVFIVSQCKSWLNIKGTSYPDCKFENPVLRQFTNSTRGFTKLLFTK